MAGWNEHQQQIVDRILSDLAWQIQHEAVETYISTRPYQRPPRRPDHRFGEDCTSNIKLVVCDWNHVPSIDGKPSGYGDTSTFFYTRHMWHVPFTTSHWQPLDIVLYKDHPGPFRGGPDEHATILTHKAGRTWHCSSHGGNSGPSDVPWNYRRDAVAVVRFPIPLR